MKIPYKLVILFSLIISFSLIITSIFVIQYVEFAVIDSGVLEMKNTVTIKQQQIQTLHERSSEDLVFALQNPLFVEYFDLPETKAGNVYDEEGVLQFSEKQIEIKNKLEQWIYHFQDKFQVDETCLIDASGQEHARLVLTKLASSEDLDSNERTSPFFEPSLKTSHDQVHIQYPYISSDTDRWVFAYSSPIVLGNGEKPAFFHFEMPLSIFQDLVDVDTGRMYVIDPQGFLIADSQYDFSYNDSINPSQFFPSTNLISNFTDIFELVRDGISNNNDVLSYPKNGDTNYVVYAPMPNFGWILAYEKPSSLLLSGDTNLSELNMIIWIVALVVTSGGIVAVVLVSKRISQPITRLADWANKQDVSNLQKIPMESDDEIGDVTKAMNSMIDKIAINEAQISKQLEDLQDLDIKKDEFASMITHELKSPLASILGWCSALKKNEMLGELTSQQINAIEKISNNSKDLKKLIEDLLDAQTLNLGKMKFNYDKINTNEMVNETINDFKNISEHKKIQFINSTKEKNLIIKSDKIRLKQVLNNLIYNAIDFVSENTGKIEINVQRKDSEIIFYVKDNGVGIPLEKQKDLFKRFYQLDMSHSREHGGTGLGLSICKGILDGLGGKIWIQSDLIRGTTFYFTISKEKEIEDFSN
ncbi:MAG TPA: sensor histidine kinase [Nitrosopumilaceae archaeon]|nr:sensor histidine kinase [Nitrosopumilaceae archaeon]